MAKKATKRKKKTPGNVAKSGRKKNGRFTKGHKGITGDKQKSRQTRELREALLEAISAKDIQAIAKKLLTKAKKGDVVAAKELFDRCLGKPHQTHEIEGELAFRLILGKPKR